MREYEITRNIVAERYDTILGNCDWLKIPQRNPQSTHVFHQYTIKIKEGKEIRNLLRESIAEMGIPIMIYYPIPLHLQKAFESKDLGIGSFPVSEILCDSVLSLPVHTELTEEIVLHITNNLKLSYQNIAQ